MVKLNSQRSGYFRLSFETLFKTSNKRFRQWSVLQNEDSKFLFSPRNQYEAESSWIPIRFLLNSAILPSHRAIKPVRCNPTTFLSIRSMTGYYYIKIFIEIQTRTVCDYNSCVKKNGAIINLRGNSQIQCFDLPNNIFS